MKYSGGSCVVFSRWLRNETRNRTAKVGAGSSRDLDGEVSGIWKRTSENRTHRFPESLIFVRRSFRPSGYVFTFPWRFPAGPRKGKYVTPDKRSIEYIHDPVTQLFCSFSIGPRCGSMRPGGAGLPFGHSTVTPKSNFHRDGNHRTSIRIRRSPERFVRSRPPVAPTAAPRRKPRDNYYSEFAHHPRLLSRRSFFRPPLLPPCRVYPSVSTGCCFPRRVPSPARYRSLFERPNGTETRVQGSTVHRSRVYCTRSTRIALERDSSPLKSRKTITQRSVWMFVALRSVESNEGIAGGRGKRKVS